MARSFDRIRSIVRKKRMTNKEKTENEANSKLEKLVNEVIIRRRIEKKNFNAQLQLQPEQFTSLAPHQSTLYRHSYQVRMDM